MGLMKKIKLYKNIIWTLLFLNIFCVSMGFILGFNYFATKKIIHSQIKDSGQLIQSIDLINHKISKQFIAKSSNNLILNFELYKFIEDLKAKNQVEKTSTLYSIPFEKNNFNKEAYLDIQKSLNDIKNESINKIIAKNSSLDSSNSEIIIVAAITLIFGIILPWFFIFLITKAMLLAKKELESKISLWIKEWNENSKLFKEDKFKNVEFWLKIFLATMEQSENFSSHPAVLYSSYVSKIVRKELDKAA